ncbi:hypothetical protein [Methylobacter svalbardensis]|uniref:hypothetical protein n=1 Tax=Methylobacter svalbardensis TaxID=3080016 RepID=UPI0030EF1EE7
MDLIRWRGGWALTNKLELIDNESFRNAVKKIPGARWNNWGNIAEWHEDKKVLEALSHLVIDKREGVLISDEGLASLVDIETFRLNDYAKRSNTQVNAHIGISQFIDLNHDVKKYGQGGRRSSICNGLHLKTVGLAFSAILGSN